jgi:Cu/Ag efflux protein CusF
MRKLNKGFYLAGGVLAGWMTAGVAFADDQPQPMGDRPMAGEMVGQSITSTAVVKKVDMKTRNLTLKGEDGDTFKVQVPDNISRLENVKPGDQLTLNYTEAVAVSLRKPGEATPPTETQFTDKASGNLPGGVMGKKVTAAAEITKIDKSNNELTLKMPDGEKMKLDVKDSDNLARMDKLKKGDNIQVTYIEAVAASMQPAMKK